MLRPGRTFLVGGGKLAAVRGVIVSRGAFRGCLTTERAGMIFRTLGRHDILRIAQRFLLTPALLLVFATLWVWSAAPAPVEFAGFQKNGGSQAAPCHGGEGRLRCPGLPQIAKEYLAGNSDSDCKALHAVSFLCKRTKHAGRVSVRCGEVLNRGPPIRDHL